jgi:hypothetical protein
VYLSIAKKNGNIKLGKQTSIDIHTILRQSEHRRENARRKIHVAVLLSRFILQEHMSAEVSFPYSYEEKIQLDGFDPTEVETPKKSFVSKSLLLIREKLALPSAPDSVSSQEIDFNSRKRPSIFGDSCSLEAKRRFCLNEISTPKPPSNSMKLESEIPMDIEICFKSDSIIDAFQKDLQKETELATLFEIHKDSIVSSSSEVPLGAQPSIRLYSLKDDGLTIDMFIFCV